MSGIFDKTPSMESIEKYVFAIKKYYQGSPYRLPFWIVHPFLLKFIEPAPFFKKNQSATDLLSRLNLALGILESGDAAGNIYNYKKNGRKKRLIALNSLILEALIFPVRWLYWQVRR